MFTAPSVGVYYTVQTHVMYVLLIHIGDGLILCGCVAGFY